MCVSGAVVEWLAARHSNGELAGSNLCEVGQLEVWCSELWGATSSIGIVCAFVTAVVATLVDVVLVVLICLGTGVSIVVLVRALAG